MDKEIKMTHTVPLQGVGEELAESTKRGALDLQGKKFSVCVDGTYIKDGKILLLKRRTEPFKGCWGLVGGHVEKNETLKEALRREFKEETNLDITVGNLIDKRIEKTPDRIKIILTFEVTSAKGEISISSENEEYDWFAKIPRNCVYKYAKYLPKKNNQSTDIHPTIQYGRFLLGSRLWATNGVSIVTTTWNERENVGKLIPVIRNVLQQTPHEIIVVDDNSSDGTIQTAQRLADVAITKKREGQSKGLLYGMHLAKYPTIITIDADLENDPMHIPELVRQTAKYDVVVASRTKLPRISEKIASKTLGKFLGVTDTLSNFRAFRKAAVSEFDLRGGETFGAEFLIIAKKRGLTIGEIKYDPPPRRRTPRIGGTIEANLRIIWALIKSLTIYVM